MTTLHVDQMTVRRQGDRITVYIPMTIKKRGGRKEIILPEGLAPADSPAAGSTPRPYATTHSCWANVRQAAPPWRPKSPRF